MEIQKSQLLIIWMLNILEKSPSDLLLKHLKSFLTQVQAIFGFLHKNAGHLLASFTIIINQETQKPTLKTELNFQSNMDLEQLKDSGVKMMLLFQDLQLNKSNSVKQQP